MIQPRQQRTIARAVCVSGFGFWSGQDVQVELRPAEPYTGLVFVRRDLPRPVRIEATVANRIEMPRRTTLTKHGASVEMVEHILAALFGMQIDNCEIWVDQPEMPGCDGSSQAFVEALASAGVVEQEAHRYQLCVARTVRLGDADCWIEARPSAASAMMVRYELDYGAGNAIGRQAWQCEITPATFARELAPARTFVLAAEAEQLRERGLGLRATYQNVLVFGPRGPLENELRFQDECVRHKMLDVVGDLALAGCDLIGQFTAHRSGHRQNADLVRALLSDEHTAHKRRRSA